MIASLGSGSVSVFSGCSFNFLVNASKSRFHSLGCLWLFSPLVRVFFPLTHGACVLSRLAVWHVESFAVLMTSPNPC